MPASVEAVTQQKESLTKLKSMLDETEWEKSMGVADSEKIEATQKTVVPVQSPSGQVASVVEVQA